MSLSAREKEPCQPTPTDLPLGQAPRLTMDRPRSAGPRRRRYVRLAALTLLAVAALGVATGGLRRLRGAAPVVERSAVWIDTVRRGAMLREVHGQGTLVPVDIRWLTAVTAARVERILVRPGAAVQADSVLVELANPDLELQAMEAARQLGAAEAELINLQASLQTQRLAQKSVVASLGTQLGDARRRATADESLARRGFLAELELAQSRDRAAEMDGRLEFEQKRLRVQSRGIGAQVAAQRAQLQRLRAIADFRRREVDGLAPAATEALLQHPWPGNVRELEHVLERAVLLAEGDRIEVADLALGGRGGGSRLEDLTLAEAERQLIVRALQRADGNVSDAARALGLSRSALYRRLAAHGLRADG
jgi:multidrug efflux pump subunit AcrA (membrane-fusion protein)